MGFLSKAFRNQIMAPIGRPSPAMGVRPMLREPGIDMIGERSIFEQPSPFGTPLSPQPINKAAASNVIFVFIFSPLLFEIN